MEDNEPVQIHIGSGRHPVCVLDTLAIYMSCCEMRLMFNKNVYLLNIDLSSNVLNEKIFF